MAQTHTPGPWRWFLYPDGRMLLGAPSQSVIHCPDAPMEVDEADRDLIASAPHLLEALKIARGYMRNAMFDLQGRTPKQTAINTLNGGIKAIDAAIAEAERSK